AANMGSQGLDMKVGPAKGVRKTDRYVTQIIPVEYTNAEELRNLLQPLLPKTDSVIAYGPTNLLIITTTESMLSRLGRIISMVDISGAREEVEIMPVKYAPVTELAGKVTQILEIQSGPAAAPRRPTRGQPASPALQRAAGRIIADERTNSIIAIGDIQSLAKIRDLVGKLDVAAPSGSGKIHVYYLQNADADEMAKVLSGIPIEPGQAGPGKPQQPPLPRTNVKRSEISIIADTSTNALVITATPEEFATIKAVIEKLDIPREQVLVEVLIAEVTFRKTLELGVEWRVADDFDGSVAGFAGSGFGGFDNLSVSFPTLPSGLVVGAIGETITFGDLEFPNLGALIRALKTDTEVNILSTPTIVTSDNKEAEIVVGQTVPFQTSQKFDANNQPIFTFDYRDVGLTLRITPQINSNGFVKLQIFSQLEALVAETLGTQELAPTTLKRKADTTVVVKNGYTVVIGGMIRDDKIKTVNRVPLLGSLPLLGALFRSETTRSEKTNLLIFLTPRIISNPQQMKEATRDSAEKTGVLDEDQLDAMGLYDDVKPPEDKEQGVAEGEDDR
ncbi:MAG: type II secretion system secretin GspD, partial [bacterium]